MDLASLYLHLYFYILEVKFIIKAIIAIEVEARESCEALGCSD